MRVYLDLLVGCLEKVEIILVVFHGDGGFPRQFSVKKSRVTKHKSKIKGS